MNIMIIMKKPFIKYLILTLVLLSTLTSIVIINYNKSKKSTFLNYPTNYSLCNTTDLSVMIYCDRKNLSFFDIDNITDASIEDIEENLYQVKILDIVMKDKVMINNHNYYPYIINLEIPFTANSMLHINNSKLKVTNLRGEEINFKIGNISMVNGDYFSLVETKSVTGMTKIIDNYATLDKIKVELYNFQPKEIYLKKAELVSSVVKTDISDIMLKEDETINLEIPLSYIDQSFIDGVGVILTWEYQGSIFYQLINSYVLFSTSTNHTLPVVQTYEVY